MTRSSDNSLAASALMRAHMQALSALRRSAQGDSGKAIATFRERMLAEPGVVDHRVHLSALLLDTRRYNEALRVLTAARERFPDHPVIAAQLGLALLGAGCLGDAEEELRTTLRLAPDFHDIRAQLARLLSDQGRLSEVETLLAKFKFNAAGQLQPAPSEAGQAAELAPLLPESRCALATALCAIRREVEAERILRDLLREPGLSSTAQLPAVELGTEPYPTSDPDEHNALPSADSGIPDDLEPSSVLADACVTLAQICERTHRLAEAATLLLRIPDSALGAGGRLLAARLTARRGDTSAALRQLDEILADSMQASGATGGDLYPRVVGQIEFERATLLDRLGRCDEAYAACLHANACIRDALRRQPIPGDQAAPLSWALDAPELDASIQRARAATPADAQAPIFLIGFPRSGTTLLDQMLDAHPQLQVMEERPAVEAMLDELGKLNSDPIAALMALTPADEARLRQVYFDAVNRYLERQPGRQLIDKSALNLPRLQVLMRIFPNARWIFAVRHPCDVVLSCFMQNFRFADNAHGFWTLESSARLYAQLMGVWLRQRERLRPQCFELRYETLISDVEGTLRQLFGFLDVRWEPVVLDYRRHALRRTISTPSYFQVVRPPYADAVGRWRRYRRWFETAGPILAPSVQALGYAESSAQPVAR